MNTNVATFPESAVLADGTSSPPAQTRSPLNAFTLSSPFRTLKLYITNRVVFALVAQDVKNVRVWWTSSTWTYDRRHGHHGARSSAD